MASSISDLPTSPNGQTHHEITTGGDSTINTEFLIIGAGPAGAALACFLGSHGKSKYSKHQSLNAKETRPQRNNDKCRPWNSQYSQSPYHQHGSIRMSP